MKYCKAWPDACQVKVKSDFDIQSTVSSGLAKTLESDAPVWPKGLVAQTVESVANQSVEALLKETFVHKDVSESLKSVNHSHKADKAAHKLRKKRKMSARSRWADDPVDVPNVPKLPSAGVQTDETKGLKDSSVAPRRERPYYNDDDTKAVWAAFAILAILFIVVVGSLMQRVRTLEASVHGRLMA